MRTPKDPASSYRADKVSPVTRFDEVETTLSHLFRRPHPALGGRSFGSALYQGLSQRGLLAQARVVELGAGAGFLAAAMAEAGGPGLDYTFVELSPVLLAVQRRQLPSATGVLAHAERLPFASGSIHGLFLANEVIADLRVLPAHHPEALELVRRDRLEEGPGLVNVGALHLVEELARVLAPGACACLTEFGGDRSPAPVPLEGPLGVGRHVEHSIHFGHLEKTAALRGLDCERVLLADVVGIDRTMRVCSYPDVLRLRRLLPRLSVLAWPKAELEAAHPLLTRLFRFEFPRIGDPGFPDPKAEGGFCQLFQALLLRQPSRRPVV